MAGIEEAFKNFVNRVSQKEQREEKSAERGYQYGGGAIGFSGGGYPPVEEDNQSIEYGRDIRTIPTGFSFNVNRPMPVYEEGQPTISGGLRDLKNYVNTTMGNINPQLSYIGDDYGANVSAMANPFTNMPKSYSANAYYGPEQNRYTLGLQTVPTVGAKQITAGYESPYGNFNLGASKDPMGRNIMANYNYKFADGGGVETLFRPRYANGGPLDLPTYSNVDPLDQQIKQYTNGRFQTMAEYNQWRNQLSSYSNSWRDSIDPVSGQTVGLYISQLEDNIGNVMSQQQQQQPKVQYQYSAKGTPIDQFGYQPNQLTPELQKQIDQYKIALDQVESAYQKPIAQVMQTNEAMSNPGAYGQTGGKAYTAQQYLDKAYQSQKDAAARVPMKMKSGGYVNTDLTRTIPPDRGPNPQGVETLFKRRYN